MIKTTVNLLDKYNISVLPVTGAALPDSRFFKKIGFLMKIKQGKAIMKITTPMTNTVIGTACSWKADYRRNHT